jgi:hypothetical protein
VCVRQLDPSWSALRTEHVPSLQALTTMRTTTRVGPWSSDGGSGRLPRGHVGIPPAHFELDPSPEDVFASVVVNRGSTDIDLGFDLNALVV